MSDQSQLNEIVWKDAERAGGKLCFRGTRVSVQALIDYLDEGLSLDRFLQSFPSVEREQAVRFLRLSANLVDRKTAEEGKALAAG